MLTSMSTKLVELPIDSAYDLKVMESIQSPDEETNLEIIFKQKAIQPYPFHRHQRPDPNTFRVAGTTYDIPYLVELIKFKMARNDDKEAYRLNKIVLLATQTKGKDNLKSYKVDARDILNQLSSKGYVPASIDLLRVRSVVSNKQLEQLKCIQDYLHNNQDCVEYDENKYATLMRHINHLHIDDNNETKPLASYIRARSYEKGMGNMLSPSKAFEEYMNVFDLTNDVKLKREVAESACSIARTNEASTMQMFNKLANEKDTYFQTMAYDLLKGIGNMLSPSKVFEEYMNLFDLADDVKLKREVAESAYSIARTNEASTMQMFNKLVNEKDTYFQRMACDLLTRYFSFDGDKSIEQASLQKVVQFKTDHFGVNIAKVFLSEIQGQQLVSEGKYVEASKEYEQGLEVLKILKSESKGLELLTERMRNNLARLYERDNQPGKAMKIYKENIADGSDYAQSKFWFMHLKGCWKKGKLITLSNDSTKTYDPMPLELFKQSIDYLNKYAHQDALTAALLSTLYLRDNLPCRRKLLNYEKSLYYAQIAEKLAEESKDVEVLSSALANQFIIYDKESDSVKNEKMENCLLKGFSTAESADWKTFFINRLIKFYDNKKEYEKALEWIATGSKCNNFLSTVYLAYYQLLGISKKSGYQPSVNTGSSSLTAITLNKALSLLLTAKTSKEDIADFNRLQLKLQDVRFQNGSLQNLNSETNEIWNRMLCYSMK